MTNFFKKGLFSLGFLTTLFVGSEELEASTRKYYSPKPSYTKVYSKKPPYAGYGKPSKVNGLPKNKIISGHTKKTSKGYTYVNPYARSK